MSKYATGTYNVTIFNEAGSKVMVKSDPNWSYSDAKKFGENWGVGGPKVSFVVSRVIFNSLTPGQERYAIGAKNGT
jgi:hypothetical protein